MTDLFGTVKLSLRSVQIPPNAALSYGDCPVDSAPAAANPTAREVIESTVPGWAVGLLIQLVLAAAALAAAEARTRTPAGRLSRGSRIA